MIRYIRFLSALAPHRTRHIVRHLRRAHRVYRAHWTSRVVCYAVAGGMAVGGGALLAHLPASAFVAPGPIVWPAAYVPSAPPIEHDHECDRPNRTIAAWCREHRRSVPEPSGLALLGVALVGLAIGRCR